MSKKNYEVQWDLDHNGHHLTVGDVVSLTKDEHDKLYKPGGCIAENSTSKKATPRPKGLAAAKTSSKKTPAAKKDDNADPDGSGEGKADGPLTKLFSGLKSLLSSDPAVGEVDQALTELMMAMDPENKDQFTNDGKPSVTYMEKELGETITAADRDRLWDEIEVARASAKDGDSGKSDAPT